MKHIFKFSSIRQCGHLNFCHWQWNVRNNRHSNFVEALIIIFRKFTVRNHYNIMVIQFGARNRAQELCFWESHVLIQWKTVLNIRSDAVISVLIIFSSFCISATFRQHRRKDYLLFCFTVKNILKMCLISKRDKLLKLTMNTSEYLTLLSLGQHNWEVQLPQLWLMTPCVVSI